MMQDKSAHLGRPHRVGFAGSGNAVRKDAHPSAI